MNDETVVLPHDSYGKHLFPGFYDQPGNDWECAAPQFIAECLHKQKHPLFAIKWIKEGKRLVTGTSKGEILTWNTQVLCSTTSTVHRDRVQAIALSKYDKFLISGDKEGNIVYSDTKMNQEN